MLVHKCSRLTAALLPATLISNPQDDDVRHYVKIYGKKVEKVRNISLVPSHCHWYLYFACTRDDLRQEGGEGANMVACTLDSKVFVV